MSNIPENFAQYKVHSRREIISLLRTMKERGQFISMHAKGGEDIVTSILDVDDAGGLVVIDRAQSQLTNHRILESEHISFETALDSIRILFFAEQVQEYLYEGKPALSIPIPENMIRLQRREHYRVPTPAATPLHCMIPVQNEDGGSVVTAFVVLKNISGGGIGVIDDRMLLDRTVGTLYKNCRLEIPGLPPVIATLQVKNSLDQTLLNGKSERRVGLMFVNLPAPLEAAVQRYIAKLERELNAKSIGVG